MNHHNPNIDTMRVIAAFAVVWLHVSVSVVYGDPSVASTGWWAGNLVDSFTRWSVPLFVMISGALLLSAPANPSPLDFWLKRLRRLLPALVFWTLVYFVFRYFFEPPLGLKECPQKPAQGQPLLPHVVPVYAGGADLRHALPAPAGRRAQPGVLCFT